MKKIILLYLILGLYKIIEKINKKLQIINQIYINKKFFNENIISINNYRKFLSF